MFDQLVRISRKLHPEYIKNDNPWADSPFAWIKTRPSRQIGAIGERMIEEWLTLNGFCVKRTGDPNADRLVNNKRAEIKFSTLWENGSYKFQQFRDQRYDFAICIGISPKEAHCWVITKEDILRLWKTEGIITSQHGGSSGSDTAWIGVDPNQVPSWLRPFGGTLEEAVDRLRILAKKQ